MPGLDEKPGRKATYRFVFGGGDLDRLLAVGVGALAEHHLLGVRRPFGVQALDLVVDLAEQRLAKIAGARLLHRGCRSRPVGALLLVWRGHDCPFRRSDTTTEGSYSSPFGTGPAPSARLP